MHLVNTFGFPLTKRSVCIMSSLPVLPAGHRRRRRDGLSAGVRVGRPRNATALRALLRLRKGACGCEATKRCDSAALVGRLYSKAINKQRGSTPITATKQALGLQIFPPCLCRHGAAVLQPEAGCQDAGRCVHAHRLPSAVWHQVECDQVVRPPCCIVRRHGQGTLPTCR
jgi:hypothetical protein